MRIQAQITQDTNFLIPNKDHKNFTCSADAAQKGMKVTGEFKNVSGLRKGQPFIYRLFRTSDGKFLYSNKVEAIMPVTEVSLSADGKPAYTKPETNVKSSKTTAMVVMLGGALAGFLYGKNKNASKGNLIKYLAVGAVGAYGIYYLIDKSKSATTQISK